MARPKKKSIRDREKEARETLLQIGRPPDEVLDAIPVATSLGMNEFGTLVRRSGYTIRRWRALGEEADIPAAAACAIEDLRSIIAMLIEAGYSKRSITSFLRSRNVGLGRDRPLDGLRSDIGEFARVEHVTLCFIEGIPPEQGRHVIERPRSTPPVAIREKLGEPTPEDDPREPTDRGDDPGASVHEREEATV
jgi:hypothetical protein